MAQDEDTKAETEQNEDTEMQNNDADIKAEAEAETETAHETQVEKDITENTDSTDVACEESGSPKAEGKGSEKQEGECENQVDKTSAEREINQQEQIQDTVVDKGNVDFVDSCETKCEQCGENETQNNGHQRKEKNLADKVDKIKSESDIHQQESRVVVNGQCVTDENEKHINTWIKPSSNTSEMDTNMQNAGKSPSKSRINSNSQKSITNNVKKDNNFAKSRESYESYRMYNIHPTRGHMKTDNDFLYLIFKFLSED